MPKRPKFDYNNRRTMANPGIRYAEIERETSETQLRVAIDLDGSGAGEIDTGIGFFDHMLTQIACHGLIDLVVTGHGDLYVDEHHLIEDVGICLGKAINKALGERRGIQRYGWATVPMDESLAAVAIDFSGRPYLAFDAAFSRESVGLMPTEMVAEFFRAFSTHAAATLHIRLLSGENDHHKIEAIFKAFALALEQAVALHPRQKVAPSSKGILETAE